MAIDVPHGLAHIRKSSDHANRPPVERADSAVRWIVQNGCRFRWRDPEAVCRYREWSLQKGVPAKPCILWGKGKSKGKSGFFALGKMERLLLVLTRADSAVRWIVQNGCRFSFLWAKAYVDTPSTKNGKEKDFQKEVFFGLRRFQQSIIMGMIIGERFVFDEI